ncbi:MAG: hypothetical protein ACYTAN_17150 [Planctomycetota bacterium]
MTNILKGDAAAERQVRPTGGKAVLSVALLFVTAFSPAVFADISPPVEDGPVPVRITMFVMDVDEIDSAEQSFEANLYYEARWHDPRLVHKRKGQVAYNLSEVWHPRLQLANRQRVWRTFPEIVEVSSNGEVVYRQRVWGDFSQPLSLADFPFDRHTFSIHLIAVANSPDEVELLKDPERKSGIAERLSVADWDVTASKAEPAVYRPLAGEEGAAGFRLSFTAVRHHGYFIAKVIIPLVLIVAMSWVVFWIDPSESGAQVSVAVTAMLTLIAYRFSVGIYVPKVSYLTRLDYFILASSLLVFASLVEVVITSAMAHVDRLTLARRVDRLARVLFPLVFVLLGLRAFVL